MDTMNTQDIRSDPSADVIMEIIHGGTRFKILMQCLESGLFDDLEANGEPCTAELFAKKHNMDSTMTEKLFNALASFQIVCKEKNNKGEYVYKNAPGTTKYLTRSKTPTMLGLCMMVNNMIFPMVDALPMLLKTGKPKMDIIQTNKEPENESKPKTKVEQLNNKSSSQKANVPQKDPKLALQDVPNMQKGMIGNGAPKMPVSMLANGTKPPGMPGMPPGGMKGLGSSPAEMQSKMIMAYDGFTSPCAHGLTRAFDLSFHRKAVDLGGGSGRISFEMSKAYPDMEITVLDLPHVTQVAQKMQPAYTKNHVTFKAGNFMEDDIPSADLFILSHVLHGWNNQGVDKLLTKVFDKLPAGGSLLVLEKVLNEKKDGPEIAVVNDLILSLLSKGQERSLSEYQKIFAKHGFINFQVRNLPGKNYFDAIMVKKPF